MLLLNIQLQLYGFLCIFPNREACWRLSRTAENCSFLNYTYKMLCMDGLSYCYVQ